MFINDYQFLNKIVGSTYWSLTDKEIENQRLTHLPKATQLLSSGANIWIRFTWFESWALITL